MEPLHRTNLTRRSLLAGIAFAAVAPVGCLEKFYTKKTTPLPPQGRLVSAWQHKVVFGPDLSRGGAPTPVVVGRVYLFGPDGKASYIGDGSMGIDMFDSTPAHMGANGEPKLVEILRIDPVSLTQMVKKDMFGEGYTILFPWSTYSQDITQIYISVRYESADKKTVLMDQSGTFSIDHSETLERIAKGQSITNPGMRATATLPGN